METSLEQCLVHAADGDERAFAELYDATALEGERSAGAAIGVTVEPAGGSQAPTSDPILVVET